MFLGKTFCAAVALIAASCFLAADAGARVGPQARKPRPQGQDRRHLVLDAAEHAEWIDAGTELVRRGVDAERSTRFSLGYSDQLAYGVSLHRGRRRAAAPALLCLRISSQNLRITISRAS
jgi:hypothetical protein